MQQSQHPHTPEDDRIIGHHVADHVTDAQPRATQATSSAGHLPGYLGPEGFNPHFPHSISILPFADAPSAPQDRCGSGPISFLIGGPVYAALFLILVTTLFPSMQTAALVPLLSGPVSRCRTRPSDLMFPISIDSSSAEL